MKKTIVLSLLVLLVGCTNQSETVFDEGRYCTEVADKRDMVNWLELEFESGELIIISPLSSYKFDNGNYIVSGNELKVTGVGLPSGDSDQYTLVFTITDDSLIFSEKDSDHFEAFSLKDNVTFTQSCE